MRDRKIHEPTMVPDRGFLELDGDLRRIGLFSVLFCSMITGLPDSRRVPAGRADDAGVVELIVYS